MVEPPHIYKVQVGYGTKAYTTRYTFMNKVQAELWYRGINVGKGYKKRLLENDKVIAREITQW